MNCAERGWKRTMNNVADRYSRVLLAQVARDAAFKAAFAGAAYAQPSKRNKGSVRVLAPVTPRRLPRS